VGKRLKVPVDKEQPEWVCQICGTRYGAFKAYDARKHQDDCGPCGIFTSVADPKDFGYMLVGWKETRDKDKKARLHSFSTENRNRRKKYGLEFIHKETV